jgi:hypothetical protein
MKTEKKRQESTPHLPSCRACGRPAGEHELKRWPFVCRGCVMQHLPSILASQAAAIAFWQSTVAGATENQNRRGWMEGISQGLKRIGL